MFSIVICSQDDNLINAISSYIEEFLSELKLLAKLSIQKNPEKLIEPYGKKYDMYIMDMDNEPDYITPENKAKVDFGRNYFIYLSNDKIKAYEASKAQIKYFLLKPIDKTTFINILKKIKQQVQEDTVIIQTSKGEYRLPVNKLNYVDIIKRSLCYHLTNGTELEGKTLRSSFEKAIYPLNKNKIFLFLSPSLLINIGEIKIVNTDHIVFENNDVLFFPKKSYEKVRTSWVNYSRILE